MKALIIMLVVVCVGCGTTSVKTPKPTSTSWVSDPSNPNNVKIEAAIRKAAKKPTGELTEADLEKVTELILDSNQLTSVKDLEKHTQLERLYLNNNKLTNVKGLEKLTQLKALYLRHNPNLTKAQIDELQKALPNAKSSATPRSNPLTPLLLPHH